MNCLSLVYSGNIFGILLANLRKSSEMIGNVRMIFGLLYDNFGADFVSLWVKFTVTVNVFTVSVKMSKI